MKLAPPNHINGAAVYNIPEAMDTFSKAERSAIMRRVRGKDTGPEMAVRRMAHRLGFRYRLHRGDLPGKPDMVFPSRRKVIFVHGCYWHGHACRAGRNRPSSNTEYWIAKLDRNKTRDALNGRRLRRLGWKVLTVWECELKNAEKLRARLARFLSAGHTPKRVPMSRDAAH
jgi:DNA mismatch endonuclease (patch repair protein)